METAFDDVAAALAPGRGRRLGPTGDQDHHLVRSVHEARGPGSVETGQSHGPGRLGSYARVRGQGSDRCMDLRVFHGENGSTGGTDCLEGESRARWPGNRDPVGNGPLGIEILLP